MRSLTLNCTNFHVFSLAIALGACASADDSAAQGQQQAALGSTPPTPTLPLPSAARTSDPLAALEEVRAHDQEPWVRCRSTTREVAADELGPVISHGFTEAPGYRVGLIDEAQARFLRRASLRRLPLSRGFLFEDTSLPSIDATKAQIKHAIAGAIRVAGYEAPGDIEILNAYDSPRGNALVPQTQWMVGFSHDRVPIRGARCRLSAARQPEAFGALVCWLPTGPAVSHEPFVASDKAIRKRAAKAIEFAGGKVLSRRRYDLQPLLRSQTVQGLARTQVVLFDGTSEVAVDLDGQGRVLQVASTGRNFTWRGLPLDYLQGTRVQESPYDVGNGQTDFLDSASKVNGLNCTNPSDDKGPVDGPYKNGGFVVCANDALEFAYGQDPYIHTLPRSDADFTNEPNSTPPPGLSTDPWGPQLLQTLSAGSFEIPWRPASNSGEAFDAWTGKGNPARYRVAAAGYADLQLFHSIGLRHKFTYQNLGHLGYGTLKGNPNPQFEQDQPFGPKYRFEIRLHRGDIGATRAGLSFMDVGDISGSGTVPPSTGNIFEAAADGSIISHEYHHHIQAELEFDLNGAFAAGDQGDVPAVAEGMADLYGAVAVNRTKIGQLVDLSDTSDPCSDATSYPAVTGGGLIRPACNSEVYPSPNEDEHLRGLPLFAATFAYVQRLRASGLGEVTALTDVYEGELNYWATLSPPGVSPITEIPSGDMRRVMEGISLGLSFNDPLSPYKNPPGGADNTLAPGRHRNALRTSFGAKKMNLERDNAFTCGSDCQPDVARDLALTTIAMAGPVRVTAEQEDTPPTFDLQTVTGAAYQSAATSNRNVVTLEFSTSSAYSGPTTYQVTVPDPFNNSPQGFFRHTLPTDEWVKLRDAAQATPDHRLYYRMKLCLADTSTCVFSVQPGPETNSATFLQLGPGVGDNGCTCRSAGQVPSGGHPSWALSILGLLVLRLRRRG